jgi:hypothetical protein
MRMGGARQGHIAAPSHVGMGGNPEWAGWSRLPLRPSMLSSWPSFRTMPKGRPALLARRSSPV